MIANMDEYDKEVVKTLLFPFLPLFTEALVQALQDKNPATSDSGLKMEALKVLFKSLYNGWHLFKSIIDSNFFFL